MSQIKQKNVKRSINLESYKIPMYPKRYWYHLVPKGSDMSNGIMSPYYMNRIHSSLLHGILDKYRNRVAKDWKLYDNPMDPESLTSKQIMDGLIAFRGKYGTRQIYMFPFPPNKNLGPNMKKVLNGKDVYQIDLMLIPDILVIDYGHDMSHTDNKKLTAEYYENLSYDQWIARYDDSNPMLFSTLNHISIVTKSGMIPYGALKKLI